MVNKEFYWNPTGENQAVEFVERTQCRYVELFSRPKPSTTERIEGILDDHSLEGWFEKAPNKILSHI